MLALAYTMGYRFAWERINIVILSVLVKIVCQGLIISLYVPFKSTPQHASTLSFFVRYCETVLEGWLWQLWIILIRTSSTSESIGLYGRTNTIVPERQVRTLTQSTYLHWVLNVLVRFTPGPNCRHGFCDRGDEACAL